MKKCPSGRLFCSVLLLLIVGYNTTTAFTTSQKQKHDRKRHALFDTASSGASASIQEVEVAPPSLKRAQHQQTNTAVTPPPVPFGMPSSDVSAAATAAITIAYKECDYYQEEDDEYDEELIGYATAVVSCFLSLALGFGLGYNT